MNKGALRFYNKIRFKNYIPAHICEVGVYQPQDSNILLFINDEIETTLVEADPEYVKNIRTFFSDKKKVKIIEAAVFDYNGKIELCKHESSTFVSQLKSSPALINDNYNLNEGEKFTVDCVVFSEIDKGTFDLISIDIEGAEWYVIKHMISRPNIISIETHGKYYTNPNIADIRAWMKSNNYLLWYKDESDSIYVKNGVIEVTFFDKMNLFFKDLAINLLKKKKIIKDVFIRQKKQ